MVLMAHQSITKGRCLLSFQPVSVLVELSNDIPSFQQHVRTHISRFAPLGMMSFRSFLPKSSLDGH
jgi:hypothetical protein